MRKLYTDKEYAEKAVRANLTGKQLYVIVEEKDVEKEVYDFKIVWKDVKVQKLDDMGNPVYDSDGNPVIVTEKQQMAEPVLEDVEVTVTVIEIDDEGKEIEIEKTEVVKKQKTHIEVKKKAYGHLEIADVGYYICFKDNFTDGTINENYEKEKQTRIREELDAMFLTASDVERALYKAKKMDFDDLKVLIHEKAPEIDLKAVSIELKANNFFRGAKIDGIRLIDTVGALLGYSSEDMDYLFKYKTLPEKE